MTRTIRKDGDRTAVQISFPTPGRTKESFLDECDVNFILNKWKRTGTLPPSHSAPPSYGDFTNVGSYMQAKNALIEADREFNALPSWVRERFQNDPAELLAFVDDEANHDQAVELGLIPAPPAPAAPPEPTPETGSETPTPEAPEGVTVTPS